VIFLAIFFPPHAFFLSLVDKSPHQPVGVWGMLPPCYNRFRSLSTVLLLSLPLLFLSFNCQTQISRRAVRHYRSSPALAAWLLGHRFGVGLTSSPPKVFPILFVKSWGFGFSSSSPHKYRLFCWFFLRKSWGLSWRTGPFPRSGTLLPLGVFALPPSVLDVMSSSRLIVIGSCNPLPPDVMLPNLRTAEGRLGVLGCAHFLPLVKMSGSATLTPLFLDTRYGVGPSFAAKCTFVFSVRAFSSSPLSFTFFGKFCEGVFLSLPDFFANLLF